MAGSTKSATVEQTEPGRGRFTFAELAAATGARFGIHDVACPACSAWPSRSAHGRRRRVLRVWYDSPGFATYHCARCGVAGFARDGGDATRIDPQKLARLKAEAARRDQDRAARQLGKARWLWDRRRPIADTLAERYLRARGCTGPFPPTLGYLPPWHDYPPTLIAAFSLAVDEPEAGVLAPPSEIIGVHLTRLLPDGSDRQRDEDAKIMLARSIGTPIVLAPINDLGGLAITEGIEDGLSVHQATGLGAWTAAAAGRMPALADVVPRYVECVTIFAHADPAGQQGALELTRQFGKRGIEVSIQQGNAL